MLTLLSKNPVKFVVSDQLAETAVVLSADDDEETLVSKLQRVIELAGGQSALIGAARAALRPAPDPADRFDAEGAERRLLAQQANGWNEDAVGGGLEDLPEV